MNEYEIDLAVALRSANLFSRKSWREMNWGERFSSAGRIVLGGGDDVLTLISANGIVPKKITWLWPNRIPLGKLTLFVGDPDNGKSMVATYVAATVSTAGVWYKEKYPAPEGEVLIFAGEDDHADTTVPRLMASGANRKKVHFGRIGCVVAGQPQKEREMQLDKDIEILRTALKTNPNIRLVIIDPVSNYLGGAEMNKEQDVRRVLAPLGELASEMGVAILGIMHLNKKEGMNPINRVGGAMAFVGVARAVWLFNHDPQDPNVFHMVRVKKNIGERIGGLKYRISTKPVKIEAEDVQQPYVEWLGESERSADDIFPVKPKGRPRDERDEASQWLKQFLSAGPKPSTEVELQCEAAGFKHRTLQRVKDEPDSGVEVFREGDKWNWKLADPGICPGNDA